MHIEFLVEELSAEAALRDLAPRAIGPDHTFRVHAHQGKHDLLAKLPGRLTGYGHWLPRDWRIVVLIDEDREDCRVQKRRLEATARAAGFFTKTSPNARGAFRVLNRLAIEELEAWFFGDVAALAAAYPGIPSTLGGRARFRDPDAIAGGTWEALERELQRAGYYPGGLAKIEAAGRIAAHMDLDRNRSRSFQVFLRGLRELVA